MKDDDEDFLIIAQVIMILLNFSIRLLQNTKPKPNEWKIFVHLLLFKYIIRMI